VYVSVERKENRFKFENERVSKESRAIAAEGKSRSYSAISYHPKC